MSVCYLLIGDGRDTAHQASRDSLIENLPAPDHLVEIDDRDHELGFAGAIAAGWQQVLDTGADWVLHHELDFTYNEPVDLHGMLGLLERQSHLAQVSLKRQPWNEQERAAGGIVEQHPQDFTGRSDEGAEWTEHRRYWTTNPSVYSARWCRLGWPQEPKSEGLFTHQLLRDPLLRFAIWGAPADPPRVTHLCDRVGHGY